MLLFDRAQPVKDSGHVCSAIGIWNAILLSFLSPLERFLRGKTTIFDLTEARDAPSCRPLLP
jgi:hypothetical protein